MAAQCKVRAVSTVVPVRERGRDRAWAVALTLLTLGTPAGRAVVATEPAARVPPAAESKTVLENDRVRAHVLVYPAGSSTVEHDHEHPRVAVALAGGRLLVQAPDGAVRSVAVKSGDVVWLRPERHRVSNPGPDEVRLVEIDVLDCPGSTD